LFEIRKEILKNKSIRNLWDEVKNNSKVKVFDGRKTMFWKDNCHEKGNLEELFPNIYGHYRGGTSTSEDI
ncbi:hypothetical protein H5410_015233, partial [Solanum commersonii]